ncbi:sulfite exporter TauE/SafE family protein [Paenarthrobacter sp. PAE-2]|uniref:sulfite exporter TauE/SafE family protein n=1 Tax=Paenarthrobacter sp. PAE-2 TaxID=2982532 RepID=UPI0022303893|nr:sulfite exporter TauE/SafE family protein [Paenarthrobacter sp. PAE-2]MCW3768563.1 sulfite exporter TauE/SafE family protein [Paenarthrobacter sp. PAE-2]
MDGFLIPLVIVVTILVGAISQRVTGMGFALVASPYLVLVLGAPAGVLLVNLCSAVASSYVWVRAWRDVEWKRFALLTAGAVPGIIAGLFIVTVVRTETLEIIIGSSVLIALTLLTLVHKRFVVHGRAIGLGAGLASGVMTITAGVGGPALSIYALLNRWSHAKFVATIQPYFIAVTTISIALIVSADTQSWPDLSRLLWFACVGSLALGLLIGDRLARIIQPILAQRLVISIAMLGGIGSVIKGLVSILL